MQPESISLLAAIRRELSRESFFGAQELAQGWSQVVAARANEVLAQLVVEVTALPVIARELLPVLGMIHEEAGAVLSAPRSSLVSDPADPVEAYVQLAERTAQRISALTRASVADAQIKAALTGILPAVSRLEGEFQRRYLDALERVKQADERFLDQERLTQNEEAPSAQKILQLIRAQTDWTRADVANVTRKLGANANEIFFFDLSGTPEYNGAAVLRRKGACDVTEGSLVREYELLRTLFPLGLSVPRALAAGEDPETGRSYIVMTRSPGRLKSIEELQREPERMAHVARALAAIHQVDVQQLPAHLRVQGGSAARAFMHTIDRFYDRWVAQRSEHSLLIEAAYAWLRSNIDWVEGPATLAHADSNFRNILFHDDGIVSLDWELARLSHAADDLAFVKTDVERIVPWPDFMVMYEQYGGRAPAPQLMRYFAVWTCVWQVSMASCIYAGYRRGDHTSFLFASTRSAEYFHYHTALSRLLADELETA